MLQSSSRPRFRGRKRCPRRVSKTFQIHEKRDCGQMSNSWHSRKTRPGLDSEQYGSEQAQIG